MPKLDRPLKELAHKEGNFDMFLLLDMLKGILYFVRNLFISLTHGLKTHSGEVMG